LRQCGSGVWKRESRNGKMGTALFVRVRRGKVRRAGGTPALRNRRVAIDIMLGLLELCVSGASNQSQRRRPEASGTKDGAELLFVFE
jgi:hypothetical protein